MALVLVMLLQSDVLVTTRFEISSGSPLVGEPVELTLRVTVPTGVIIVDWPRFPTDWPPFEVMQVDDLVIEEQDGQAQYTQRMQVTIWEPGDYESPRTVVQYRVEGEDEIREAVVKPVFLSVPSVLDPDDTQLRPLRAQIVMRYLSPLVVFGGISLMLVLAAAGVWYGRRRYGERVPLHTPTAQTPEGAALADLQRLSVELIEPETVYMRVSDRLRQYMGERYGFPAQDMTSDEIMTVMREQHAESQPHALARLLHQADMVKFARQIPTRRHAEQYVRAAAQWVRSAVSEDAG